MYRKLQDFLGAWKYESEATHKILSAFTDISLGQKVGPDDRTLGRIAWHLTTAIPEMMGRTGLRVAGVTSDAPCPASATVMADAYRAAAISLAGEIEKRWTDADLEIEDEMYGEKWKRGSTLGVLIAHQTHHRGQATVLMRQAGLKVPGIYGPAREEWGAMGMNPPEV
jgi:uncharacterized damage-inducible protein DinB